MVFDSTAANNISEWITITALDTIHDLKSSAGQAWLDSLRALGDQEECDGFQNCCWSRVTEDKTQVFIWTSWAHKLAYDLYADGDVHRMLFEKLMTSLALRSSPALSCMTCYRDTPPLASDVTGQA